MNTALKYIFIGLIAGIAVGGFCAYAGASFNEQINYQGKLANSSGVAVADGSYCMKFVIYDALTNGSEVWSEVWTANNAKVATSSGLFSVLLGSHTAFTDIFNNASRYLEVQFDPECDGSYGEVFAPRKQLGSVPSAVQAHYLGGATWEAPGTIGSTTPNTGAFNPLKISQIGGTAGKYTIFQGGAQTADLTYTLPTASADGYLKNTSGALSWSSIDLSTLVPYTGANATVNLGSQALSTSGAIGGGAITGTSFVIGANTLTTAEWANLDGTNQTVATTSSPTFANITDSSMTVGSILFAGSGGLVSQDNGNFFYTSTGVNGPQLMIGGNSTTNSNPIQIFKNGIAGIRSQSSGSTAASGNLFLFARSRGSIGAESVVQSGDRLFSITGQGYDSSTTSTARTAATIKMDVDGTPGASDMPGRIVFGTTPDGSATVADRWTIDNTGTLKSGTDGTGVYNIITAGTVTATNFLGGSATTSDLNLQTTSGVGATGADMHFLVGNNGATEAMTILNSGNVGIGTASPATILELSKAVASAVGPELTLTNLSDTYNAGQITFRSGSTPSARAAIRFDLSTESASPYYSSIVFATGLTTLTDRATILGSNGNFGVNVAVPVTKEHIYGTSSSPSLSADNGIWTLNSSSTVQLQGGGIAGAPYSMWLQAKQSTNGGASFPLSLQPLGGKVVIGAYDPAANEAYSYLTVAGTDNTALQIGVENAGTGQVGTVWRRTGGTASRWNLYSPSGSTDLRLYSGADLVTFQAGGNVGIGTANPSFRLQVGETSNYGYVDASGNWVASSDVRFKTNVKSLDDQDTLSKVLSLNPFNYDTIGESSTVLSLGKHLGFAAQEVEKLFPELVSTDNNGNKGLNYAGLTAPLAAAIQAQQKDLDALKTSNGLQMIDHATKDIYCTWIENGEWQKAKGECSSTVVATAPVAEPEPVQAPAPVVSETPEQTLAQVLTISSLAQIADINVVYGTVFLAVGLPANITATLSDASTRELAIIWDSGTPAFDANTAGIYIFSGEITLPENVTNPNSLKATANVYVAQQPAPEPEPEPVISPETLVPADLIQGTVSGFINTAGNFIRQIFVEFLMGISRLFKG